MKSICYSVILLMFFRTVSVNAQSNHLFKEIESEHSGITFKNDIKENLTNKENLFDFDFFYNGAGVAVVDLNNDGLQDLVFSGNQKPNEVYINKGEFRFSKIPNALSTPDKFWSNGVSIVDINADGFQDIYISQGGPHHSDKRKNLLYINNGDLTFTESAQNYGLSDKGISTQAAFFDYDKDGDLDCVVMNENELYGRDPISFYQALGESDELFWESCSHFYINSNGKYEDATADVGMLKPSFGLGLSVSDLNEDGLLDVYIANDYYIPDAMYINQGDGTFKDEIKTRTSQISFYGMGVDVADVNNDGLQDIFVLDMASSDHYRSKTLMRSMNVSNFRLLVNTLQFPHQYMFNSLQLGDQNQNYYNVSQFSGLAKTDWSWSVLMNDFDLDGNKDVFITNGYRRYALDNDFQNEVGSVQRAYAGNVPLSEKERLYNQMPVEPLSNIIYQNTGNTSFKDMTESWGLDIPTFSNGAAVGDLDNDGDLDLVINNIDSDISLYKNLARDRKKGNYLKVIDTDSDSHFSVLVKYKDGTIQRGDSKRVRGYMSSSENAVFFGVGDKKRIESVEASWLDGSHVVKKKVKSNQTLTIEKPSKSADPLKMNLTNYSYEQIDPQKLGLTFHHQENDYDDFQKEVLLPFQQSTLGPNVIVHDVNKDQRDDILLLGAAGQPNELYLQTDDAWEKVDVPLFDIDKKFEDLDAVFFDLNNDGWDDLYMITGGNEKRRGDSFYNDRIYINEKGNGFSEKSSLVLDQLQFSGKDGEVIDFDGDGDDDLIITNRIVPQMYPYKAPSFIFENRDGELVNVTRKISPDLQKFGIINDLEVADINGDGKDDFIAIGEWTAIGIFINKDGVFKNETEKYGLDNEKGWWMSVTEFEGSNDDMPDFILGNVGLNSKYTATKEKPLKVYAGDMDGNNTWDLVLSKKYKDKYVPFRGKECSTQQMPFISEKFPTYDLFASASINEVYGEQLEDSYEASANTMASIALISKDGKYTIEVLPAAAQYAPILDGITLDDKIVLCGNIYNTEVETPRLDMGRGVEMYYQNDNFKVSTTENSGLLLEGNVKAINIINHKGKAQTFIIAVANDAPIKVFYSKSE